MKKKINIIIILILSFILLGIYGIYSYATGSSTYEILVDVEESRLYLFKNGKVEEVYICSGGKSSTPSPIGTWKIISKGKWGEGFGGSFMGIDVPWGKFGIHGNENVYSVGWASSHGCIRMKNDEVAKLYKIVPIGTKVTIVDGPYGAFGKGFRDLKSGMYGSDVLQIQKKLKQLGFFTGTPNGKFGIETEKAVEKYCRENGIYVRKTISVDLQKRMGFVIMD